ncbi:hypothetical protein GCM10009555_101610 [Acrocarpospora macrocephala]|uniref:ABC transmembrane type-1 domain-containing protein n=1 Tax=Acrocarpospora macrocephala TaxID=150177 RepID=A0A5M3WDD0_9ACTN|nr:carbohydrate ABC transporter permease [Acrocarpospora macrocephala]GES07085.1 hypothetical protein Amac_006800 [Acrocarpospora macrocephala]
MTAAPATLVRRLVTVAGWNDRPGAPAASGGPGPKRRRPRGAFRLGQYAALAVILAMVDLPLLWMVLTSVRPDQDIVQYPPQLVPRSLTLDNFRTLFADGAFTRYLVNSGLLAVGSTVVTLVLGVFAAYAVARFGRRFRIARWFGELSLLAYLIPGILLLVPIAQLVNGAGLANQPPVLIVLYAAHMLPFAIWVLRSYFRGETVDLEEAAMVDGCSRFGALRRVVLPQALPGLVSTGVFVFNMAWSEYMFAATFLTEQSKLTLSVGVSNLLDETGVNSWGLIMAAGVVTVLPPLILYVLAQRRLVEGLGEGAVR